MHTIAEICFVNASNNGIEDILTADGRISGALSKLLDF